MNVTGVILDNNESLLNNEVTGLMRIEEVTLIEKQVNEMKSICEEVILVTDRPSTYLPVLGNSIRIITNYFKGSQTLSALHAALSLAKKDLLWVVTPDMPFLSAEAISLMVNKKTKDVQLITPECNGSLQLFHSLYDRSCINITNKLLEEEHTSIMSLMECISFKIVSNDVFLENNITIPFTTKVKSLDDYKHLVGRNENDSAVSM